MDVELENGFVNVGSGTIDTISCCDVGDADLDVKERSSLSNKHPVACLHDTMEISHDHDDDVFHDPSTFNSNLPEDATIGLVGQGQDRIIDDIIEGEEEERTDDNSGLEVDSEGLSDNDQQLPDRSVSVGPSSSFDMPNIVYPNSQITYVGVIGSSSEDLPAGMSVTGSAANSMSVPDIRASVDAVDARVTNGAHEMIFVDKKRNRMSTNLSLLSTGTSLQSSASETVLKRRSMINLNQSRAKDEGPGLGLGVGAEGVVSGGSTRMRSSTMSGIPLIGHAALAAGHHDLPQMLNKPPIASPLVVAATKAKPPIIVEKTKSPNIVIVQGQKVELRPPKTTTSSTKRVNSFRKSLIKLGGFGKDSSKDKEKDSVGTDAGVVGGRKEGKERNKSKKEKDRVKSVADSHGSVKNVASSGTTNQRGVQTGAVLQGYSSQKASGDLRSLAGGGVQSLSPSPSGYNNATKRISEPQIAGAEQLQHFSRQGMSTMQQMLQTATQEYEIAKAEYRNYPTEINHTAMEQKQKIVRRLEAQCAHRHASISSEEVVSPDWSSRYSSIHIGGDTPTIGYMGSLNLASPTSSADRTAEYQNRLHHDTSAVSTPSGISIIGKHRKMMSMGGGVAGRQGGLDGRLGPAEDRSGSEPSSGDNNGTLTRSHSDSYKRRLLDEQNSLRATASTDAIEKLRVISSREAVKRKYAESRTDSRSLEANSDDMSDPPNDRLSPLTEQPAYTETLSINSYYPQSPVDSQRQIMSMEDGELSSDEETIMDHGVFSSFTQLRIRPAHLAVFLHYLISNSDPSPLLLYLVTESYQQGSLKEMRKWAYEIYSIFLVNGAVLKVPIDDAMAEAINQTLLTKFEKEDLMKSLFVPARNVAQQHINYLMDDFRTKRKLGLGNLYGDHELSDHMDHAAEMKIVESSLMSHLEHLSAEEGEGAERSMAIAASIATFFKHVGFSSVKMNHIVDQRCSCFNAKDKGKLLTSVFGGAKTAKKSVRGHTFLLQQYYSTTYCYVCNNILCGIGAQGYQCSKCELNVHKHCVDVINSICTGKREKEKDKDKDKEKIKVKEPSMFNKIGLIRKPSSLSNPPAKDCKQSPSVQFGPQHTGTVVHQPLIPSVTQLSTQQSTNHDELGATVFMERVLEIAEDESDGALRSSAVPAPATVPALISASAIVAPRFDESRIERTASLSMIRESKNDARHAGSAGGPVKSPLSTQFSQFFASEKEKGIEQYKDGHVSRQIERLEQKHPMANVSEDAKTSHNHLHHATPSSSSSLSSHSRSPEGTSSTANVDITHSDSLHSIDVPSRFGFQPQVSSTILVLKPTMTDNNVVTVMNESQINTISPLHFDDSDLETEAELPSLEVVIGKEAFKKLKPKERKRQDVINELFYTERAHVRNLKIMKNIFCVPMRAPEHGQSIEFVNLLFPNIDELIDIHGRLNSGFKRKRKDCGVVDDFANILVSSFCGDEGVRFKQVCATFCEKQSHALEYLKARQRKDPKLQQFLQEASEKKECRRFELKDFLPMAMQRLTKYPMLIEGLLKYTQPDTEEYKKLLQADQGSREILNHVNKAVQDFENRLRLAELQKRLDKRYMESSNSLLEYKNIDLTRHRLMHDGSMTWRISRDKLIPLHVVLLNDLLLLLQKQDDKFVLRCQSMLIAPGKGDTKMTHSPIIRLTNLLIRPVATDKRAFFLVSTSGAGPQIYDLVAGSKDEKNKWCKHIADAIEANKSCTPLPELSAPRPPSVSTASLMSQMSTTSLVSVGPDSDASTEAVIMGYEYVSRVYDPSIDSGIASVVRQSSTDSTSVGGHSDGTFHTDSTDYAAVSGNFTTPTQGGTQNLKLEDDEISRMLQFSPLEKLHESDDRLSELLIEKSKISTQLTRVAEEEDHAIEISSSDESRFDDSIDAASGATVSDPVIASLQLVEQLIHLTNSNSGTNSRCILSTSSFTESSSLEKDDEVNNVDTNSAASAGDGSAGERGRSDDVIVPVAPLIDIITELQRRLTSALEQSMSRDEDNKRLRLELELARKQVDNMCSRPVSMVSSGDELAPDDIIAAYQHHEDPAYAAHYLGNTSAGSADDKEAISGELLNDTTSVSYEVIHETKTEFGKDNDDLAAEVEYPISETIPTELTHRTSESRDSSATKYPSVVHAGAESTEHEESVVAEEVFVEVTACPKAVVVAVEPSTVHDDEDDNDDDDDDENEFVCATEQLTISDSVSAESEQLRAADNIGIKSQKIVTEGLNNTAQDRCSVRSEENGNVILGDNTESTRAIEIIMESLSLGSTAGCDDNDDDEGCDSDHETSLTVADHSSSIDINSVTLTVCDNSQCGPNDAEYGESSDA